MWADGICPGSHFFPSPCVLDVPNVLFKVLQAVTI